MGIRSNNNWSGTVVNGVTLGEPAVDEVTGVKHWDGGVPNGVLDAVGMFQPDGVDDAGVKPPKIDLEAVYDVKYKPPKEDGSAYLKGDILEKDGVVYACNKDGLTVLPPHKDWLTVKTAKPKEVK